MTGAGASFGAGARGAGRAFDDGALHFAVGIEDTFVPQVRPGHRALDEYELTDHYRLWRSDIDLAADSGADAIRYGVPWYRVEPEPGRFVWDWFDPVVDHLLERGLVPIVDLVHYGTPLWLDNAAINASYPERVAAYAYAVASRYADRLHVYTPANEPAVNAEWCGETAAWPPYLTGPDGWTKVATGVARGIVLTQQAVAAAVAAPTFVHVEAAFRYELADGAPDEVVEATRLRAQRDLLIEDLVCGLVDGDHPLVPFLHRHGVSDATLDWHGALPMPPDVMGVNFYPHLSTGVVEADVSREAPARGRSGADGLEEVLRRFHDRYGRPVFLTETSSRGDAAAHLAWLEESVTRIVELRAAGLPVVGYTWFPLFDLLDWSYRTGTGPAAQYLEPLGLYRLSPDPADELRREHTAAVDRFRQLATTYGPAGRPTPAHPTEGSRA
ncbi:family 1 glycosylhydrolase [Cellulomonas sp. NTE-D12]|uniref:family 1 glycosylhydrolase n=1 Tax=Cellulomonas sp. NTE-D12 TaxID=2962632 RepID=UPI00308217AA|nr:hypothetical protein CELD12_06730 [Cellulomonas sp. NTE-D12]